MNSAGIDIGSRTIKVVAITVDGIIRRKAENTFDPLSVCRSLLEGIAYDRITATGYGRHLFKEHYECDVISEIKAFAIGARATHEDCRTILDIGGQDIKVISLDESGRMRKFEMNDKCSAGTGRFLEIMAMALGCDLSSFSELALTSRATEKINSMCTVFAESEVISLLAQGKPRNGVALGIHKSVTGRARSMLRRVPLEPDVVFVGGVARNKCIVKLLGEELDMEIHVPDEPQLIGALGCALSGMDERAPVREMTE